MIRARSETVTEKRSFRSAAAERRALIPVNRYHEWQKNADGTKTLYHLHGKDEDTWLVTATILTRAAHDALGHIHD